MDMKQEVGRDPSGQALAAAPSSPVPGRAPSGFDPSREEVAFVEAALADSVICADCGATLDTYAELCSAPLDVACPGFMAVEAALLSGAASLTAPRGRCVSDPSRWCDYARPCANCGVPE